MFIAFLAWGAFSDYRDFIIPNRVCLAIVLLYPAYLLTSPVPVDWMTAIVISLSILAVTTIMFSFGLMGGGDVKFYTATALWAGPALTIPFLLVTAIAGGVLAVLLMARGYYSQKTSSDGKPHRHSVPYGVAIATGGLFVVGQLVIG